MLINAEGDKNSQVDVTMMSWLRTRASANDLEVSSVLSAAHSQSKGASLALNSPGKLVRKQIYGSWPAVLGLTKTVVAQHVQAILVSVDGALTAALLVSKALRAPQSPAHVQALATLEQCLVYCIFSLPN